MSIFDQKVTFVTHDVLFGSPVISIEYNYWYVNNVRMERTSQDFSGGCSSCCSLSFKRDEVHFV